MKPNFSFEKKWRKKGFKRIAGIDEAGRGPLAGPVIAAAVTVRQIPNPKIQIPKINDSKKLSTTAREKIYQILTKNPLIDWGVGRASVKEIDKLNIKNAAELAMWRAIKKLKKRPDFLLVDGNHLANKNLKKIKHELVVKGDAKIFSCAAASILAKVARDRIMGKLHKKYPQYRFDVHKGYPTKLHRKMLKKRGPSSIHRKSFKLF